PDRTQLSSAGVPRGGHPSQNAGTATGAKLDPAVTAGCAAQRPARYVGVSYWPFYPPIGNGCFPVLAAGSTTTVRPFGRLARWAEGREAMGWPEWSPPSAMARRESRWDSECSASPIGL